MKKIKSILCLMMIISCAFLFVACGQVKGTSNNDNGGTSNNGSNNSISYTVEVVGGSGSGTYRSGDQVTIVSNDDNFLWWQIGETTKFSTSKSYTFTVDKNIKVVSCGIEDKYVGFAIMELPSVSLNIKQTYEFSCDTSNSTASINGTQVAAKWQGDFIYESIASNYGASWGFFSTASNNLRTGAFTYELKGGNYVYIFHLYEDLDGSIKAVTTVPTKYSKSLKTTETLATGARITFQ